MSSFRPYRFMLLVSSLLTVGLLVTASCAPKSKLRASTQPASKIQPAKIAPTEKPTEVPAPSPAPRNKKEPLAASLMFTRGITGGIVAPHVSLQVILIESANGIELHVKKEPHRHAGVSYRRASLGRQSHDELWARVEALNFWDLPREYPMGSEDIYGFDVGLNLRRGQKFWRNGAPGGCLHGKSKVQADTSERERFESLLKSMESLAEEATEQSDKKQFDSARRRAAPPAQVRIGPGALGGARDKPH